MVTKPPTLTADPSPRTRMSGLKCMSMGQPIQSQVGRSRVKDYAALGLREVCKIQRSLDNLVLPCRPGGPKPCIPINGRQDATEGSTPNETADKGKELESRAEVGIQEEGRPSLSNRAYEGESTSAT